MSEVSVFVSLTEVFVLALIPNILIGRKKAAYNRKRWYTKFDGQYCGAWFALLVWCLWVIFTHFLLYPLISSIIEHFYTIIGINNAPIVFLFFFLILRGVFQKDEW